MYVQVNASADSCWWPAAPLTETQLMCAGASLHLCMTPHGPDTSTYEQAIQESNEEPKQLQSNTLAFMFETNYMPRITAAALGSPHVDRDYYRCWEGLKSHFDSQDGK